MTEKWLKKRSFWLQYQEQPQLETREWIWKYFNHTEVGVLFYRSVMTTNDCLLLLVVLASSSHPLFTTSPATVIARLVQVGELEE